MTRQRASTSSPDVLMVLSLMFGVFMVSDHIIGLLTLIFVLVNFLLLALRYR